MRPDRPLPKQLFLPPDWYILLLRQWSKRGLIDHGQYARLYYNMRHNGTQEVPQNLSRADLTLERIPK